MDSLARHRMNTHIKSENRDGKPKSWPRGNATKPFFDPPSSILHPPSSSIAALPRCALCVLLWQFKFFAAALLLAGTFSASSAVHYVDVNSTNATPPYTNWTTAATNIQDAVDAAVAGDQIVVTNGIYATGGRAVYGTLTNRVAVNKPLALRSVNGPQFTTIDGAG